jgi:hypothetical protein
VNVDREALSLHRAELVAVVLSRFAVMTERIEHRGSLGRITVRAEPPVADDPDHLGMRPTPGGDDGTSAATTIHHH